MPSNPYIENVEKWKEFIYIDYFSQFARTWIPFNAWYSNSFPSLKTDREVMDTLKTGNNKVKDRISGLIRSQSPEAKYFREQVQQLHFQLEQHPIRNKGEQLRFNDICVDENPTRLVNERYDRITYFIERNIPSRPKGELQITVTRSNGHVPCSITQNNGYDWAEIEAHAQYQALSLTIQVELKARYERINPRKPVNLLTHDTRESHHYLIGDIRFIRDEDLIAKAILTILYSLRNALFHGHIVPDKKTNKVYEPAYHILRTVVEALE